MFALIASLLGSSLVPLSALVWADSGLVLAATLGTALLASAAGIAAMRERTQSVYRVQSQPPVVLNDRRDSRLPNAA